MAHMQQRCPTSGRVHDLPVMQGQNPDLEENVTLIRALRDSNAPKHRPHLGFLWALESLEGLL